MRKFLGKTVGLWRLLAVIFTLIFVLAFAVGGLLEANSAQVNRFLGTTTSAIYSPSGEVYTAYTPTYENSTELVQQHVDIGTRVGAEGSVLLQNVTDDDGNAALPLNKDSEKITIFGVASTLDGGYYGMAMGGTVDSSQNVSLYDALTDRGAQVNPDMKAFYDSAVSEAGKNDNILASDNNRIDSESQFVPYEAQPDETLVGNYDDVGIVVIGRPSSEAGDYFPGTIGVNSTYTGARNVLALTNDELDLIDAAWATCDKVVVLINSCNAMELGPIMTGGECEVDAIMWIGFPGNYGYYGIADALLGNSNPSGRLTDTYAYNSTSAPAMQNFGLYMFSNADQIDDDDFGDYYVVESESIYTGYKYYETRYEDTVLSQNNASSSYGAFDSGTTWTYGGEVAYSFGEGLSYTTFEQTITDVSFSSDYREATVKVTVENTGDVAGRSVVQVYGQSPYTSYDKEHGVEKASVQLLNYGKTKELAKGETTTISIPVEMQYLASYDSNEAKTYIMEATTAEGQDHYYFSLGCNEACEGAHAAVNNILAAKGKTPESTSNVMDSTGNGGTNGGTATWQFDWDEQYSTIFATSKEGVEVTNQLDDADLNYYLEDYVTYLSRSDWRWLNSSSESMWKTSRWTESNKRGYTGVTATDEMLKKLGNDTYTPKTGDDVSDIKFGEDNGVYFADMFSFDRDEEGNVIGVTVLDYDDPLWDDLLDELDLEEAITFVAQGNRNYSTLTGPNFLGGTYTENGPTGLGLKLPTSYQAPWFDSKDPNGNYSWNDMASAPLQAATFDQDLMEEIGKMWGNDSLYINLPVLWAPSINVHRTQYNGRSAEYYSEDGVLSGYSGNSVAKGAQQFGLIVTLKHFAFNDQESNRCGLAEFMTEQQARENELRGFQIALEGDVKAIMTSYNRLGCTYSGANEGLMSGILRGEWDYKGYAVSDNAAMCPNYMTYTESILYGTSTFDALEIIWGDGNVSTLVDMYKNDATMLQAIKDAVHHTLWTFANSNMANYMTADAVQVWVANWWRVTYITLEVVFGVFALAALAFYVVGDVIGKDEDDEDKKKEGEQ